MTRRLAKSDWFSAADLQEQMNRAMSDPVCRLLNGVSTADTQQDVLDVMAEHGHVLKTLSREHREKVLRDINEMVDAKPL